MTYFRKLFFKKVEGIRDTYVLEEGDIALDESDGKLYRGDGSTVGGIVITPDAGIGLTNLSVATSSADGGGGLVYNNATGQFTFTPAVTSATDTLDTVTGRGATTTNAITVGNILTTSDAITLGNSSSAGSEAVAIGKGTAGVGDYAQAIGNNAGNSGQGVAAVAIGSQAGETSQGTKAIAIGQYAGQTSQAANSIVINATGSALQNTTASSLVVKPIRSATNVNFLKYNSTSGEITYDNATYLTGISGNNIAELANVHNASPSEGDVLTWDNTLSYWKPAVQTQLNLDNLSAGVVDVSADSIAIIDANDSNASKKESIADLVTAIAGVGISATSGVLSVAIPTTFGTIAVAGQNSVTSDTSNDTLTLVAGSNMTITTDSGTDTITFASTGGGGGGGLSNIVEDTTPQLGGNLDAQAFDITTTGKILFANMYATEGDLPNATTYHGMFAHVHATGAGYFAHGGNWIKLANDSQLSSYQTTAGLNSAIDTHLNQSGPTSGYVLSWNGSDYAWVSNAGGGGGGLSNVVEDTTPQLGGALDTNGNNITFGTDKAQFGAANDLGIWHNGAHSIIRETGTGSLYLQSDDNVILSTDSGTKKMVKGVGSGEVILYHNDVQKLNTSTSGVTVVDELHTEGATPHLTLKRTDNANVPSLRFKGSGGTIGASIEFDGTGGTSNEIIFKTFPGLTLTERFRVTYTGANVVGNLIMGESNTDTTITTNGTGDLTLSTNSGTDSGTIILRDGVNGDIILETDGTGDVLLKGNRVGIGSVNQPDTTLHLKDTNSVVTLQRTADANQPGIDFQQSGGNVRATLRMDGTSGTSNEVFVKTDNQDGAGLVERIRVGHSVTTSNNVLRLERGVHERFATLTGATGTVAHDCSTGVIFYHTGAAANFTANFTNLTIAQEDATNIAIIINQGNTAYIPNAVQIGGAAQTIIWQSNNTPTGTDNGTDSFSFTILNDGGTYVVLGQMVSFGGV
tara:strand:+ start:589 stop:3504 length:2916 start_codon:yes stop_codon:yes gene_type:complete